MKKFGVNIVETRHCFLYVEAGSDEEAEDKVREMYDCGDIDFDSTHVDILSQGGEC